jgi:hypothetical protein
VGSSQEMSLVSPTFTTQAQHARRVSSKRYPGARQDSSWSPRHAASYPPPALTTSACENPSIALVRKAHVHTAAADERLHGLRFRRRPPGLEVGWAWRRISTQFPARH